MESNKKKAQKYSAGPVADHTWVTKDGYQGKWRGPAWHPHQVPSGPKLQYGSRVGASVDGRSRGVYFGNPGLPRCTYATTKVGASLGPAVGVPKCYPRRVSEAFPKESGTHMDDVPAAFVLEGVFGFNPNKAREIRSLREQLALCEADYAKEERKLNRELKSSQNHMEKYSKIVHDEDISRRDLELRKVEMATELEQIRAMIDEQAVEIKERKKEIMRAEMSKIKDGGVASQ